MGFQLPIQEFEPELGVYDLIWHQWVLLYLPDERLVQYLERCRHALREGGVLVAKENVAAKHEFDDEDNSVTRTDAQYNRLFKEAGFRVVAEASQDDWPEDLYALKMYALQPLGRD